MSEVQARPLTLEQPALVQRLSHQRVRERISSGARLDDEPRGDRIGHELDHGLGTCPAKFRQHVETELRPAHGCLLEQFLRVSRGTTARRYSMNSCTPCGTPRICSALAARALVAERSASRKPLRTCSMKNG